MPHHRKHARHSPLLQQLWRLRRAPSLQRRSPPYHSLPYHSQLRHRRQQRPLQAGATRWYGCPRWSQGTTW